MGENVTHGIFNDDSAEHLCYLRIVSISNIANIERLNITIYNSTNRIFTKEWTQFDTQPTSWENFTVAPHTKYAILLEISGSSDFQIEIKENNS